tara:strand:- start:4642 stop:5577 length:936 start_codon:yes stop_codon:yes gene_type:complete
VYLTAAQLQAASAYNTKAQAAGLLTGDHIAIAMAAFQQSRDLTVDGMAGPDTREALDVANEAVVEPVAPGLPVGKGMFVRSLASTGEPAAMVQRMADNGLQWVCVLRVWQEPTGDARLHNGDRMVEYAAAVHAAGYGWWLWGYPVPGQQDAFADVILDAADQCSAQGVIIDPEQPYKGTTGAGTALLHALMPGCIDRQMLLGCTSYGAPWYHPSFPWREFATVHFALPQTYDAHNNLGAGYPAQSHAAYRAYGYSVIVPASGAWGKTEEQMTALLANTPTPQGSIIWWDWVNASNAGLWAPVAEFSPARCP